MKLRTTHNSIRIRIRKSELVSLERDHIIKENICFPNNILFQFGLSVDEDIAILTATLEANQLFLKIPKDVATHWFKTNQVSIETSIDLANKEQLHLLIEKDFPCLDRENENKSDTFWELAPETTPKKC